MMQSHRFVGMMALEMATKSALELVVSLTRTTHVQSAYHVAVSLVALRKRGEQDQRWEANV